MSYMLAAVVASPFVRGVDVVVGTSPQFFTACAAHAVSRLKRIPFVFELRDLWPESIKAVGMIRDGFSLCQLERIEYYLYRKAVRIVALTHSFKRRLASHGIPESKIEVVTNGVELMSFGPRPKDAELLDRYGLKNNFVAGYIGTHGLAHSLETILEAATAMRVRPEGNNNRFLVLGDGARKAAVMEEARRVGLDNAIFLDSVPKHEVARHWSLLDVAIVHLRDSELFNSVIPSKLFEAMAMGIPVLHGVRGESAEIVEREGVGLTFEPESAESLSAALVRFAQDASLRDRLRESCLAAAPRYDRSALALRMLDVIEEATGSRSKAEAVIVGQP